MNDRDQTSVFFENAPKYTIEFKGVKNVKCLTAGSEKNRMTAMLATTNWGEKLTPFFVFMGAPLQETASRPRKNTIAYEIQHPEEFDLPAEGIVYDVQQKGWFDDVVTMNWLNKVNA